MHKKNKNNGHFYLPSIVLTLLVALSFVPFSSFAQQDLPPLPPLPPLPGFEDTIPEEAFNEPPTPTEEVAVPEVEPEKSEDVTEIAPPEIEEPSFKVVNNVPSLKKMEDMEAPDLPSPTADEIDLPDFGLFDPSQLPSPPVLSSPSNTAVAKTAVDSIPEVAANKKVDDSELTDLLEAPTLPALPPLPQFSTEVEAPKLDVAKKSVDEVPALADLTPPDLPENRKMNEELADALPSWVTDETLPSLKPLPEDRLPDETEDKPVKVQKAQKKEADEDEDQRSLADLIQSEINQGENYDADSDYAGIDASGDNKRVVWPKNFKTQKLPPKLYRKQYSNANRHLPHAIYQKEIQAQLFSAVGANNTDAVRALLRTGVPISIKNAHGDDLVMHAVRSYAPTSLQLVLALGAQPSHQDRYGATPLHRAVFMGRQDIVTILLRAGANSYVQDMSGVTPMAIAVARNDQPMMQTLGYYQGSAYSNRRVANYQPY